jgi:hypothetical protein
VEKKNLNRYDLSGGNGCKFHLANCTSLEPCEASDFAFRTVQIFRMTRSFYISGDKRCGNGCKFRLANRTLLEPCEVSDFAFRTVRIFRI